MINWLPPVPLANRVEFPGLFTAKAILLSIMSPLVAPVWRKAGYLRIEELFAGEYLTVSYQAIDFGKSRIVIPATSYRLSFEPVRDLIVIYPNTTISLYPLTLSEFESVMPLYAPLPGSLADQPVLDSLPTTFSAQPYNVATPAATYQALVANTSRQTFAVTNTGNATVFLDLDAPTGATKRFTSIPSNGTYVCDFAYVGAVFIWSTNAQAQVCEVREMIQ
jgi:hypothetical protein